MNNPFEVLGLKGWAGPDEIRAVRCKIQETEKNKKNSKRVLHPDAGSAIVILALSKWLVGQGVKTPPSHGGIMGSIPVRATELSEKSDSFFLRVRSEPCTGEKRRK